METEKHGSRRHLWDWWWSLFSADFTNKEAHNDDGLNRFFYLKAGAWRVVPFKFHKDLLMYFLFNHDAHLLRNLSSSSELFPCQWMYVKFATKRYFGSALTPVGSRSLLNTNCFFISQVSRGDARNNRVLWTVPTFVNTRLHLNVLHSCCNTFLLL